MADGRLTPSSSTGYKRVAIRGFFTGGSSMRKFVAGMSVAAFVVALGVPAFAKTETVKGELVDQACYMKDHSKNVGEAHKECAVTCAKKGQAVALLTEDGKVY